MFFEAGMNLSSALKGARMGKEESARILSVSCSVSWKLGGKFLGWDTISC